MKNCTLLLSFTALLFVFSAWPVSGAEPETSGQPVYGPQLEDFAYPYPVKYFTANSQQQQLEMAYLDVPAKAGTANGQTMVLMHGKNFCAATWEGSIKALSAAGYRVIAPDQIGFCKSAKPRQYQFSFHQLAANTRALLDKLKIADVTVMGHSMGGMLATRFALQYPDMTNTLVMVNPIGLEDWKALGVPYRTIDEWYQRALNTSADGIRNYQRNTYYAGQWRDEFEPWVQMQAGMFRGEGREQVAWNSALTADMIFTQPVVYEFPQLKMPVILLIGDQDNTAIGKDAAPKELQPKLGNYAKLGPAAAAAIPNAQLIRFADLGHSPHIQTPERFHQALLQALVAETQ
ncbi:MULTISPECIES: alpha/beta fold hydrolase [unclassified Arsukibacterium]|uniref:alpha/beta fold hydrolase n=1 Tax=unclassified Arsukibacterium TaxID=2635278 RepID=UPI000E8ED734|nr:MULTISPECIES: alpha/beta hydrolase [unclassified Arsukibacterium]HAW94539.1 alpha/beta hydrolase [Candidatus Azambacteria bacterium]